MSRVTATEQGTTALAGGIRTALQLTAGVTGFPSVFLRPHATPAPAVLLLHGYNSRKEVMADTIGRALLTRGVATLAVDLPYHGARGNPLELQSRRSPLELARTWRLALHEALHAVRYLSEHPDVRGERIGVAGYSLGSFLALTLAADEPRVSPVVLAAGGDLPTGVPLMTVARAVVDPTRAARRVAGRPLLMLSGRYDRVILPEQAERLYAAAREPKEIRWWDGGHALPGHVIADAADWIAARMP